MPLPTNPRLLAFESSTRRCSAALLEGEAVRATREERGQPGDLLLPFAEALLGELGWEASTLDALAVGIGPGSFTGTRVGVAAAKGLALALGVPLLGVGSLRAMARAAAPGEGEAVAPVVNAGRGEVFAAIYAGGAEGVLDEVLAPLLAKPEVARARVEGARLLATEDLELPGASVVAPPHAREVGREALRRL
ncbi:MAG TPA: tRNA (adenosine(37)-N6)-threonylcarbamoyltransferase complex dimerization subunit type 1 TsaB, partial [Polyangiaceae bacterium LLY-WYZ-15_(1-7)]|nr:tRNA (adenosine(37)-N6)-threonylcarbamoyltransferase complex dimerization subunit type 1 TsaB [Polyangiaceae bacterium LLY-WYZ-15_(1-7)]